jgi:hypothetical protein
MRPAYLVAAFVSTAAAALLGLFAADVREVGDRFDAVDAGLSRAAATAPKWDGSGMLPHDPARRILDVDDDRDLRQGIWYFKKGRRTSYEESATAFALAGGSFVRVGTGSNVREASQAQDLLGVLAYYSRASSGVGFDESDSVAAFAQALLLDPVNDDAKYNLELVLRALRAEKTYQAQVKSTSGARGSPSGQLGGPTSSPLQTDY